MRVIFDAACIAILLRPHVALGQASSSLPVTALPGRHDSLATKAHGDSTVDPPHRSWPTYMMAGAVIGGALVAGYAVAHCDQNCRDVGALAYAPPFIIAGGAIGGLVGLTIGLVVDNSHRGTLSFRISVRPTSSRGSVPPQAGVTPTVRDARESTPPSAPPIPSQLPHLRSLSQPPSPPRRVLDR